ncbi:MAG: hypothetical protein JWN86_1259 [Planctomycetota bacterium]|nr:hypothetical protein [Planctomycetota bacterium]
MSRSEAGGFFRGAEFSRLIILAAMLAIGWPMVVYFGFAARKPAAPRPTPIASLPPLPPADPDVAFKVVLDKTPRTARDDEALALLLERARETPAAKLAAEGRREITPVDLLKNPKRYRGIPIHLDGYAEIVYALDDQDPTLTPKKRLYEVWFRSLDFDQRMYPCCLILEDVPATLPGGKDLGQRVMFDGFFLKLLAYQARDTFRPAPMLVGRLTHFPGEGESKPTSKSRNWIYPLLGVVFAYIFLRVFLTIRKQFARKPEKRQYFPSSHEAEPGHLDQWLAGREFHEDEADANEE